MKIKLAAAIMSIVASQSWAVDNWAVDYAAKAPIDLNMDGVAIVCLNEAASDCDYYPNQYMTPWQYTNVKFPLKGQLTIPHQITEVLGSGELHPYLDTDTNVYVQKGTPNGSTTQSYGVMDSYPRKFSEHVKITVDSYNKRTILSWDIPAYEVNFGNVSGFSNLAETDWRIDFAVKGYPYFRRRASYFNIRLSSSDIPDYSAGYSYAGLPKLKFGYSMSN